MKKLSILATLLLAYNLNGSIALADCKVTKSSKTSATLTCTGKNTISCSGKKLKDNGKSLNVTCPFSKLTVNGSAKADKITLKGILASTLKVNGKAGNDTINVSGLESNASTEDTDTEDPNVTIDGGPGDDTIIGSDFDDTLDGGEGDDDVSGGDGDDEIDGGDGDDTLSGDEGDDSCDGEEGDDDMWGGDGDDFFDGGPGDDFSHHFPGDNDQFDNGDGGDDQIGDDDHE